MIVDGNKISQEIYNNLKKEIPLLNKKPKLVVVLVGEDPASVLYVSIKEKKAQELGIQTENIKVKEDATTEELVSIIHKLNQDDLVTAILIQLPLPKHIDTGAVLESINEFKDVDGLNPKNMGKLLVDKPFILPPTPAAILEILRHHEINLAGKHVVLVGYGKLVGKPLAAMISLSNKNATLSVCNSKTKDLPSYTQQADILISASGVGHIIKKDMIKKGAIVIDAGTSKLDGEIVGDVNFEEVKNKASLVTPPKGGVGPITVAKLLENVVKLAKI